MRSDQDYTGHNVSQSTEANLGRVSTSGPVNSPYKNDILFRTRASRLVGFFPNELIIQEKTVSVIRRDLMVSSVETIPVRDIGRVVYINTPVFASIEILGKNTAHDLCIRGINRRDALQAKRIIESLLLEDKDRTGMTGWIEEERRRTMLGSIDEEFQN